MSMHSHIQDWDLHDPDIMPETRSSKLCRVTKGEDGELAVLKFLKPIGVVDEGGGAALLEYYNGLGAVRMFRYDTEAHLLEYADKHSLLHAIDHGSMADEEAAQIAADVVKKLHMPRIETSRPQTLVPLRTRFNALFDKAMVDTMEGKIDSVFIRAAALADRLINTTKKKDVLPLHGDLHHENIVRSSKVVNEDTGEQRGWLAIDPKGLIGDKAYDVSNMFANPLGRAEVTGAEGRIDRLADIFSQTLGYDRKRILGWGAAHAALSASWSLLENRPAEAEGTLAVAQAILAKLPTGRPKDRDRALEPAA